MSKRVVFGSIALAGLLAAQVANFGGQPAVVLSNDRIELSVARTGAALRNLVLRDDRARLSPLWKSMGHFLCLDGFGAPSKEEDAAGYPFHGEANHERFEIVSSGKSGAVFSLKLAAKLPLAQEAVTRTLQMVDGENVVYIETEVESLASFDRPISWAEHATLGAPYLEPGKVTVDMPAKRCRVRPWKPGHLPPRLIYDRDFEWPMAPLRKGGTVSLIGVPEEKALDLATCQIDPARSYGYVAALQQDKRLLFGYLFHREEYPWLMSWMNYTGDASASRGMEFSTQPFDVSRRETVDAHDMFGAPTYRWLPAKSRIQSRFLAFYTRVPEGFTAVADVTLEEGQVIIRNQAGETLKLKASLPL
jgi:hypothetical protein